MFRRTKVGVVAGGLSALLMVAAAGSASAGVTVTPGGSTITPANGDFGRLPLYGKGLRERTYTITKGPGDLRLDLQPSGAGSFVTEENDNAGFGQDGHGTTCTDFAYLDAAHPSCTVNVSLGLLFKGSFGVGPGLNKGLLFISYGDSPATDFELPLRGIGVIPRNHRLCRTRNGHPLHPKYFKYCQRKKHKKK
jgi:hypothetical protein